MRRLGTAMQGRLGGMPVEISPTAIAAGGVGGFNPVSQFDAGQKGWVYDFNDLSTLFEDSALTTPATVNGPVGGVRDKSPNGANATQANLSNKPLLRGTPTGANLASGATWTAGTGWSVAGNTATATTSSGTLTAAAVAAAVGRYYRVTWTITRTEGSVTASFGGRTGVARSASGTYVGYFDNTTNTNALVFTGSGFSGTVTLDAVELVDVSAGSVAAPYGLQFDGIDDFLQTAAIDFSASDEIFLCAGVRKLLGSAGAGCVFELSASLVANNGTFHLFAPISANDYRFSSKGTAQGLSTSANTFVPPISNVLTGTADISTDTCALRVNGVAATPSAIDQGTGNFGNYAVFIGRRGGASFPLNGLLFSSVCRGGTLPDATLISKNEGWVAARTGVTL